MFCTVIKSVILSQVVSWEIGATHKTMTRALYIKSEAPTVLFCTVVVVGLISFPVQWYGRHSSVQLITIY